VCRLNQGFGNLLVDSGDRDRERDGQHEAARVAATETNFSTVFESGLELVLSAAALIA